ncbi:MAG: alkaline phosphatase family protein, partial [Actinomycetota bacterium]
TLTSVLTLIVAAAMALAGPAPAATAQAAPAVTQVSPDTGPVAGGTSVVITGDSLAAATAVDFGSIAASFSVASPTEIVATAPAAAGIGPVQVTVTTADGTSPVATGDQFTYSALDHLFVIVMENEGESDIIGDTADAPYLNSLASSYGQATDYSAVDHPSLPNYLALTSGQDFDSSAGSAVEQDCSPTSSGCSFAAANLAVDRLDPAGLSWKAYQESMPSPCALSDSSTYLVHHNPFVYYDDLNDLNGAYPSAAAECDSKDVPYTQLPADLGLAATTPNFVWITPNACDDMHDNCTNGNGNDYPAMIHQGDSWAAAQVPAILASPAFTQQRSALVIVWDENEDTSTSGPNQVPAIVVTSSELNGQPQSVTSSYAYSHYAVLRTAEWAWGLQPLTANDAGTCPMADLVAAGDYAVPSGCPAPAPAPPGSGAGGAGGGPGSSPANPSGSIAASGVDGYWLSAADGGLFDYGAAAFAGSQGGKPLNKPVVGMAATSDGAGYWQVASDGGIFAFGDAQFYGSTGGMHLNKPIVGMAATPDGGGYWLVASDGGIFNYGDARFFGSSGGLHLNKPIVGMAPAGQGLGYWLVASDGGIFGYGQAPFYGSGAGAQLGGPVVGMASVPAGSGYWLAGARGEVLAFGTAPYLGSDAGAKLVAPMVAIAPHRVD